MPYRKLDVNEKYGLLRPIIRTSPFPLKRGMGSVKWLFQCDCGNTVEKRAGDVLCGFRKSCGCTSKHKCLGKEHPCYRGHNDISKSYWSRIRYRCEKNNKEFTVTIQEAWEIFEKQERKCALSGRDIYLSRSKKDTGTASLDRIDSSKGYTVDNVQWVHKRVNLMKNVLGQEDFISWCKDIWEYQNEKKL